MIRNQLAWTITETEQMLRAFAFPPSEILKALIFTFTGFPPFSDAKHSVLNQPFSDAKHSGLNQPFSDAKHSDLNNHVCEVSQGYPQTPRDITLRRCLQLESSCHHGETVCFGWCYPW